MSLSVETEEIKFSTSDTNDVKNLTSEVNGSVKNSDIREGICLIYAPHTTGILALNEDEKRLKEDFLKGLYDTVPEKNEWEHDSIDDNAHSHIKSILAG
ncbi:MAG: secondary thiamine-phosphate synthase enzyme YjbQ, partial [Candidatus Aenigmatarchaeota archaeon]